jgi:hypothetical protein
MDLVISKTFFEKHPLVERITALLLPEQYAVVVPYMKVPHLDLTRFKTLSANLVGLLHPQVKKISVGVESPESHDPDHLKATLNPLFDRLQDKSKQSSVKHIYPICLFGNYQSGFDWARSGHNLPLFGILAHRTLSLRRGGISIVDAAGRTLSYELLESL